MILFDVNVLIYSMNPAAADSARYREWIETTVGGSSAFGVADLVLSAYVRLATNRKIFPNPSTVSQAIDRVEQIRNKANCIVVHPGPRHWQIFTDLCRRVEARGNLVSDAYLAALAIESGSEWITTDRDYARFPGLRWRHPLDG